MGQQSLIYSFVARGTVILAEYTEFTGNFTSIAAQCLQKLPATNNKFTYNCDGHTFNYLVENGFTYCVVAVESAGRQIPIAFLERVKEDFNKRYGGGKAATAVANSLNKEFGSKLKEHMQYCVDHPEEISKLAKVKAQVSEVIKFAIITFVASYCVVAVESAGRQIPIAFLERVKEDFNKRYGGGKAATAVANSLNKEFGSKLKEHMQYCVDHPEEISKLAKVKAQVSEVKGVMMENIEKVLDRGEKIELLVDKTENLRSQAQDFRQNGTQMRRKMWLQNMKVKLIVLGILLLLILIIILSVCRGFKC
ncbi:unnamed protein product [Ilex paraguariensis]|uniref:Vesicle-associated membrane protein 726 n=1 Tax=Ilex paraguariensis TaxID=185542 RepID=A0ABC8RBN9_9AQUA